MSGLSAEERGSLDSQGYMVWPGLLDSALLLELRAALEAALRESEPVTDGRQTGTRHASDLAGKAAVFGAVLTHPKLLAAADHILGRPFRVSRLSGRDPLPGFGQQGLHADWYARASHEPFSVVTAIWPLDDFTPENGSTRIVPGTHRIVRPVPKALADPAAHHPDERIVSAPAGSVLVFNGHLWHSGTRNREQASRRALQCIIVAQDRMPPA